MKKNNLKSLLKHQKEIERNIKMKRNQSFHFYTFSNNVLRKESLRKFSKTKYLNKSFSLSNISQAVIWLLEHFCAICFVLKMKTEKTLFRLILCRNG